MIQTRNIIFNEKKILNNDIKAAKLEFKKIQTAQNMSFDQLIKFLQQLNEMKTTRQLKSDRLNLDNNNNIVMPESDNTDSDDHNSHNSDENQL